MTPIQKGDIVLHTFKKQFMTRYDKIYIPCEESERDLSFFSTEDDRHPMKEAENVIVLTVEEAKELWNAAQDRAHALQLGDPSDTKIFEAYMESKGINIEG